MKQHTAGSGEKKTPAGKVVSTWMERQFAALLEEKAEATTESRSAATCDRC